MFITNRASPAELISEFFRYAEYPDSATSRFKDMAHDADLCPKFQKKLEQLLRKYAAHATGVEDIQGFTDEGVDVAVSYNGQDLQRHRIGFQIKSWKEINTWANGRSPQFLRDLRDQIYRAQKRAGCHTVYILPCGDTEIHRKQIRALMSDFKNDNGVVVMKPSRAFGVLSVKGPEMHAFVSSILNDGDEVLRAARAYFAKKPKDHAFMELALQCHAHEEGNIVDDKVLMGRYDDWCEKVLKTSPDFDGLALILDAFNNRLLTHNIGQNGYDILLSQLNRNVSAVYFDQNARFGKVDIWALAVLLKIVKKYPGRR